jgi:hypothetical protein
MVVVTNAGRALIEEKWDEVVVRWVAAALWLGVTPPQRRIVHPV